MPPARPCDNVPGFDAVRRQLDDDAADVADEAADRVRALVQAIGRT